MQQISSTVMPHSPDGEYATSPHLQEFGHLAGRSAQVHPGQTARQDVSPRRQDDTVFGVLRVCRHSLAPELHREWMAHLCGCCLGLRDRHGQVWRTATNTDAVALSVLATAVGARDDARSEAAPCVLRGMRRIDVIAPSGSAATHAAGLTLAMAAVRLSDHADDRDGLARVSPRLTRRVARRVAVHADQDAASSAFDTRVLATAVAADAAGAATAASFAVAARPTAAASAAAFAHLAVLADRPDLTDALADAGAAFGRIVLVLDAATDLDDDRDAGRPNPLQAEADDDAGRRRAARRIAHAEWRRMQDALTRLGLGPDADTAPQKTPAAQLATTLYGRHLARSIDRVLGHEPTCHLADSPQAAHTHARRGQARRQVSTIGRAALAFAAFGIAAAFDPSAPLGPDGIPIDPAHAAPGVRERIADAAQNVGDTVAASEDGASCCCDGICCCGDCCDNGCGCESCDGCDCN